MYILYITSQVNLAQLKQVNKFGILCYPPVLLAKEESGNLLSVNEALEKSKQVRVPIYTTTVVPLNTAALPIPPPIFKSQIWVLYVMYI